MTRTETIAGLRVLIDEPEGAAPQDTLVFLHGWPDNAALWDRTVAALSPRWRCVRFTWPGFGPDDAPGARSLKELTDLLHRVVQQVGQGWPVTLVLHDWGCLFGYHYARTRPQFVQRVVGIDVGDAGSRAHRAELPLKAKLVVVGYQLWLAAAFRIGGTWGDRLAQRMAAWLRVPQPERVRAQMGYPYWIAWTGAHGSYRAVKPFEPAVPMLYVYGRRKPFQFQSRAWCQTVASRPDSAVVKLDAGHWVMREAPAAFHRALGDWLA
jgi:pimeloyl-ACP methyl ester carboxylesterase